MNFAPVLAVLMLRIIVLAPLLILGGTSFTGSPAQAQVIGPPRPLLSCWTLYPVLTYEDLPWFEAPSCPSGWVPHCDRQSGACMSQFGIAYLCREWRCIRGSFPQSPKRDESRCEPPTCPVRCDIEPLKCNPRPPFPFR
jgi:hypothetical protein